MKFDSIRFSLKYPVSGMALFLACAGTAMANERPDPYTFEQHIRPIMENHCFECHGAEFQDGELRLDIKEDMLAGGDSGNPALVPGEIMESYLMQRILMPDRHVDVMPPRREPRMSAEDIVAIAHWIAQGAQWEAIEEEDGEAEVAAAEEATAAAPEPAPPEEVAQEAAPEETSPEVVQASTEDGIQFATHIWPIFQESCLECHSESRDQGGLRLDSIEGVMDGGDRYGPAVIAGNAEESPLYQFITLPEDHIDFMPASGDPLTESQRTQIRQWIEAGAEFGDWESPTITAAGDERSMERFYAELAEDVAAADPEAIDRIRGMGAIILPLNAASPLLRVDFSLLPKPVDDNAIEALLPLSQQLTWLNLANSQVTESGLAMLEQFPHLTRLNLEQSNITDEGLAHLAVCENLYYLNLYGTAISDEGLTHLLELPALEQIYLWQTTVTPDGADRLREAYAEQIRINLGVELEATASELDEEEAA